MNENNEAKECRGYDTSLLHAVCILEEFWVAALILAYGEHAVLVFLTILQKDRHTLGLKEM